jgi:drug/metabolite transporter (DMT)-like permease
LTRTHPGVTPGRVIAAFATLYLVWGSTYLGIRIAVETLPPFLLAGARFMVAGAAILWWAHRRGTAFPTRREWLGAAGVGLCLVALSNALIVWVEQRVASGVVALFAAGSPLLIALFTRHRTGTPLGVQRIAGLALGTVGLMLLGTETFEAVPDVPRMVMLATAMIAWSIGATYGRDWPQSKDLLMASGAQMFAGGMIAVAVGVLLGEGGRLDLAAASWQSIAAWSYLTVFGSMLAYTVFQWLMEHVDATAVSSYTYVNPIVALALGAAFADEPITPRIAIATLLLVPAVGLVVVKQRTAMMDDG